jgi:hypothetical protein
MAVQELEHSARAMADGYADRLKVLRYGAAHRLYGALARTSGSAPFQSERHCGIMPE